MEKANCGLLAGLVGLFVCLVLASPVYAQAPTEREKQLEGMVQQLLKRVDELEKRVNQNESTQQTLQKAVEQIPEATAAVKEDPNALNWTWSNGLTFGTKNGDYKFKLGARLQNDWYAGSIDDGDFPDGTRFRRAWLTTSGTIYEDFNFKITYDISNPGTTSFHDVYFGYDGFDFMRMRLGQFKEPFSLEEVTSDADTTFMERSPLDDLTPRRETGLMLFNEVLDKRMTWAVGAFKNVNEFGDGDEDDAEGGNWDVMARVTGLPWYEEDGKKLLHLGLAGGHREWSDEDFRIRTRGSFSVGDRLVDTGLYDVDSIDQVGAEFGLVYGPASLQAEYAYMDIDPTLGGSSSIDSFYVQGAYTLTGESRPYKEGVFSRIKPKENFSLKNGGWGAWELAARYTHLDLTDAALAGAVGGELDDYVFGINWYLNPTLRMLWDYVHSESSDTLANDQDADAILFRLQIDF